MSRARRIAACAAAAVAAGCGGDPTDGPARPAAGEGTVAREAELLAHRVRDGGRTLDVLYGRSSDERLREASVREREDGVGVRVVLRRPAPPAFVRDDLRMQCATHRLAEPLGGRPVVDAATGVRVPPPRGLASAWIARACPGAGG